MHVFPLGNEPVGYKRIRSMNGMSINNDSKYAKGQKQDAKRYISENHIPTYLSEKIALVTSLAVTAAVPRNLKTKFVSCLSSHARINALSVRGRHNTNLRVVRSAPGTIASLARLARCCLRNHCEVPGGRSLRYPLFFVISMLSESRSSCLV